MLGRGDLKGGLKSELYVNMMDPYKTMWPWILSWVGTDKGRFVVPVPAARPDSAGVNDLALMARGDLLVLLPGTSCPGLLPVAAERVGRLRRLAAPGACGIPHRRSLWEGGLGGGAA